MAELSSRDRLQPSLIDRLTDDEPEKKQESREKRVISRRRLREAVLRDLTWLFNTGNLASCRDLDGYPAVSRSVVNFGMPDLAGVTASKLDVTDLEKMLRQVVLDYEPRLLRHSLRIRAVTTEEMSLGAIAFEIEGELWGDPIPEQLYLRSDIDLETGEVEVHESTTGGR